MTLPDGVFRFSSLCAGAGLCAARTTGYVGAEAAPTLLALMSHTVAGRGSRTLDAHPEEAVGIGAAFAGVRGTRPLGQ